MSEEIRFIYEGFSPSSDTQAGFKDLFEQLRDQAPISSNVLVTIRLDANGCFRGQVKIISAAGQFSDEDEAGTAKELGIKLFGRSERQLDCWKSARKV